MSCVRIRAHKLLGKVYGIEWTKGEVWWSGGKYGRRGYRFPCIHKLGNHSLDRLLVVEPCLDDVVGLELQPARELLRENIITFNNLELRNKGKEYYHVEKQELTGSTNSNRNVISSGIVLFN